MLYNQNFTTVEGENNSAKNVIEENKEDEQIVTTNIFQVFIIWYNLISCYIIYLFAQKGTLMLLCIIWQKTARDQRFSTEVTGKSLGMLNQYFRKLNTCSAFNQVSQENESEAKGRD